MIRLAALFWVLLTPSADPLVTHARAAMYALETAPRSPEIADAIVTVVRWYGPLPRLTERQSVDVMLAIAETEGHWDAWALGDSDHSVGWGQIYYGPRHLLGDALGTAKVVYRMVAASFRACGRGNPLGMYVRGPKGCRSARGVELGGIKMRLAGLIGGFE